MGFQKGHKLSIGNKGGGRKGYEFEKDQQKKMQSHVNWLFAYIDAVRKGKNTERSDKVFDRLEKVFLKEMDKLHPNKNQTEHSGEISMPQPIYGGISGHNSDKKDIPTQEKDKSS